MICTLYEKPSLWCLVIFILSFMFCEVGIVVNQKSKWNFSDTFQFELPVPNLIEISKVVLEMKHACRLQKHWLFWPKCPDVALSFMALVWNCHIIVVFHWAQRIIIIIIYFIHSCRALQLDMSTNSNIAQNNITYNTSIHPKNTFST
jgi:hypothetical protein